MQPCSVSECTKPAGVPGTARGWCSTHYSRWLNTGDPLRLIGRKPRAVRRKDPRGPRPWPLIDRLMAKVAEDTNGCWIFGGALNNHGYGRLGIGGRTEGVIYAHRVTYEYFRAAIPDGLVIDHLCRIPACCNPWHLEPVTQRENMRRARRDNPKIKQKRGAA